MIGTGTLINAALVIAGTLIGTLAGKKINEKYQKAIFSAIGVSVMFIGICGVVKNEGDSLMLVLSMVLGGILGEFLDIEARIERLGEKIKARVVRKDDGKNSMFTEGFLSASILFLVGAMAIVGSINDGLMHDPSVLITKGIIDGISSVILAATYGIGVGFSAISILVYQGTITLLASLLSPLLTDTLVSNMAYVGGALIFCVGLNMLFPKKIRVGNLLPAMFMPILLGLFIK